MKGWREVPMPAAIEALPKDERGFPITFVTLMVDGRPDFTTIDGQKILRCIQERLCGLCGTALLDDSGLYEEDHDVAFIGGPLAIENRNFLDPPMHEPCAAYAMQVCPHIVHDTSRYRKQDFSDGMRQQIFGASDERPDRFGMLVCPADAVGLTSLEGQPVFLIDEALDDDQLRTHWQHEPHLDEDGEELLPYFETRYFKVDEHDDCALETVLVTKGQHRASGKDFIAVLCPGCSTATTITRITDTDEIARINNQSEED